MKCKIPVDTVDIEFFLLGTEEINICSLNTKEFKMCLLASCNDCDCINVELYGNIEDIKVFSIGYGNIELDENNISDELKKAILEYVDKNYQRIVKENESFEHDETY